MTEEDLEPLPTLSSIVGEDDEAVYNAASADGIDSMIEDILAAVKQDSTVK